MSSICRFDRVKLIIVMRLRSVIMSVLFLHKCSLVAISVIASPRTETHISRISLFCSLPLLNLLLGILIKAKNRNNYNLVVQQSTNDQKDKAENCLPVEDLKTQRAAHNPNEKRP